MADDWTLAEAEDWLLGLELFGMRFGLERMRELAAALGDPQRRYRSVHVVGSNGKSSTTRMIAAILQEHGLASGAFLSPHLVSFTERILVGGRDLEPAAFAASAARVRAAAARVDAARDADDGVTQFEAVAAVGFDGLAHAGVEVAAIEAGLGGRHDATSVVASEVQVLTSVGLEHTRWLGDTIAEIAAEKLAVVREGATLVVGAGLHPDALALARRTCAERGARLVQAPADAGVELLARGRFQRANFATAREAARALLGELDDAAVARAAAGTAVPGRFELVARSPDTIYDGAHNPDGIRVLAAELPALAAGRRLVACVSVLEDKDAGAMLGALAAHCAALVLTQAANPRAVPAAELAASVPEGACEVLVEPDPHAALAAARAAAGEAGVVVVTGSLYLLADLLRPPGAGRGSIL